MTIENAIDTAFRLKLKNEPVSWKKLGEKAGVHPEKIRARTRRLLKKHRKNSHNRPKILVFDLETTPLVSYIWSRWQKHIPDTNVTQDSFVLCWAAKWLFEDSLLSDVVTSKEAQNQDDYRIMKSLWALINEADIIIGHNALNFDIKVMNGRFLKHGLELPNPYQVIDTYRHAAKKFRLTSSGLNFLARYLGLPTKTDTNFKLWVDSMKGDSSSLNKMNDYCKNDVKVLEDVYLTMRPYIQPHPNVGVYVQSEVLTCPSCGHDELEEEGTYATSVNLYKAHRCKSCGSIARSRTSLLTDRTHITSSVPR